MFVLHNFLNSVVGLIDFAFTIYLWLVIGRAVVSWINNDPYNPIVRFLYDATEPVLIRIRRMLPVNLGGVDFSPFVLILAITFLQSFIVSTLREFARIVG